MNKKQHKQTPAIKITALSTSAVVSHVVTNTGKELQILSLLPKGINIQAFKRGLTEALSGQENLLECTHLEYESADLVPVAEYKPKQGA